VAAGLFAFVAVGLIGDWFQGGWSSNGRYGFESHTKTNGMNFVGLKNISPISVTPNQRDALLLTN
jgi:hypothetical protein